MNNDNTLLPQYRFPEFKDDGSWIIEKIDNLFKSYSGGTPTSTEGKYYNGTIPFIRSAEIDRKTTELFLTEDGLTSSSAKMVEQGDLLVALYGANSGDVAISKINGAINQAILCLKSSNYNLYTKYYLEYSKNRIVNKFIQGGQGNLSGDIIKSILLPIPPIKSAEQQKIAACLSSLDDIIAGHEEKLTALEEHKKGLMQNLFPQEGETQPKYRFPEFENDGDWDVRELESISLNIMVGIASAATHAYRSSGIVLFRNQNIKSGYLDDSDILFIEEEYEKSHKNKRLKAGDLLTARTGYPGTTCVVPEEYEGSQSFTTLITRPDKKIINSYFLSYYINSDIGQEFFETKKIGGGQKNVNATTLAKMPILFPNLNEQQKIASVLSSVDELIVAQREKIETLKEHKKGLMQGLFPKIES